jgi:hypothetical protein
VVVTNYTYTTNTTTMTTTTFPSAGAYVPPVATNTLPTTSSTYPSPLTFFPPVTTNTTPQTSGSYPGSGTYVPPVTTNYNTAHPPTVTGYTYNKVTGYIYSGITGYTYSGISGIITNISYITNYTQFAEPGIVLTNGATLPPNGLSVVTPDPAYIVGNWNVSTDAVNMYTQTASTAYTRPSAIFADAVTILSPAWNPNNATATLTGSSRNATPDTVNAAILTGIVPSNDIYYSGGVENFVRFQENWSGVNFYYNGSMVEMFSSQIASAPWPGTGTVYNPPNRNWAFDNNFTNPSKLPPLTPSAIYIDRAQWISLAPRTTQF